MGEDLKARQVWSGIYKGIRFEINNYKTYENKDGWTFYLHLLLDMWPKEIADTMLPELYFTQFGTPIESCGYNNPLNNLVWHGGLTWLSNETKQGQPFRIIKAGCDYQHLWDENQYYCLSSVLEEVKECIDSLLKYIPPTKTSTEVWDEFRLKFPKENTEHRRFNIDGAERPYPEHPSSKSSAEET